MYDQYKAKFAEEEVDAKNIFDIDDNVLVEWNVQSTFHRKRILREIKTLGEKQNAEKSVTNLE